MKRHFFLLLMLSGPPAAFSQSPIQEVIDNALILEVNKNTENIISMLQQQLDEAKKQSESLNDQLTRMGDPSAVTLPALKLIKEDIALAALIAADGAGREARLRATTGSEAFSDATGEDPTYGLMAAVTSTHTFKDRVNSKRATNTAPATDVMVTVDRDPSLYKMQGALMGDLTAISEKSTQADERIKLLEEERPALLDQLSAAKDVATAIKLQAALNTIEAQIASARADLTKSKQDYEVLQEKIRVQAQIEARAKSENKAIERKHYSDLLKAKAASSSGTGSSSSSGTGTGTTKNPFSGLQWGATPK